MTPSNRLFQPAKQDKRFKNETWSENAFFDYMKQHYLLMSRYFESSVRDQRHRSAYTSQSTILYPSDHQRIVTDQLRATNPAVLDATVETAARI